jgi:hypothetical protein
MSAPGMIAGSGRYGSIGELRVSQFDPELPLPAIKESPVTLSPPEHPPYNSLLSLS